MTKCVFDSCCGCIGLYKGTKILGIIMVILKLARLAEVSFLIFMSFIIHAFGGLQSFMLETMLAMPVISAVVIMLQLAFLIIFVVQLFQDRIYKMRRLYTANAVCFGIECVAVAIFLFVLILNDDDSTTPEMRIGFSVGDIFASVLNLYFILLLRSCLVREEGKVPPIPKKGEDGEDIITIPFMRV